MTDRNTLDEPHAPAAGTKRWTREQGRRRLLFGVAMAALLAGGAAWSVEAATAATPLFAPNTEAGARAPTNAASLPGFSNLVAAVKPAVVSVRVKARGGPDVAANGNGQNPFEGTPFEKFFRDFGGSGRGNRGMQFKAQPQPFVRGLGSGFLVSADGYIVTNNHVVDNAVEVEVVTDAGKIYKARVIGTDARTDLALIKVDGHTDFPFVKLASAQPQVGEWVVAMGNPFGLGGTVTAGIVSAEGRDIGSGPYDDFIQIDAPVNRGNSGGPTFNLKGEVIGVNTAIYSPSGGSVGIAFDIPASTVKSVIPQLQQNGVVSRGWLGVAIQPVTPDIADGLGLKEAKGALVSEPEPGSPAAKAGLQSGDVILSLDGKPIVDARDLARRVADDQVGKNIKLDVLRAGQHQEITVALAKLADKQTKSKPAASTSSPPLGKLGIAVAPANEVDGAGKQGLAVIEVAPDGTAVEAGLEPGDVILKAGQTPVSSAEQLSAALDQAKSAGRSKALLLIKRKTTEHFVAVPVAAS